MAFHLRHMAKVGGRKENVFQVFWDSHSFSQVCESAKKESPNHS